MVGCIVSNSERGVGLRMGVSRAEFVEDVLGEQYDGAENLKSAH